VLTGLFFFHKRHDSLLGFYAVEFIITIIIIIITIIIIIIIIICTEHAAFTKLLRSQRTQGILSIQILPVHKLYASESLNIPVANLSYWQFPTSRKGAG
jgi:uncharacterized membrane protein